MRKSRKLIAILATLALLATLLVPMVGPAGAAVTYSMSNVQKVSGGYSGSIGNLTITFDAGTAIATTGKYVYFDLPTSPTGYVIFPSVSVGGSVPGVKGTNYFDISNGATVTVTKTSDKQFKVYAEAGNGDSSKDSLIVIPLSIKVPSGVSGNINLTASAPSSSTFSSGTILIATVGTSSLKLGVENIPVITSSGGSIGVLLLNEDTNGALLDSGSTEALKLRLPPGFKWKDPSVAGNYSVEFMWGDQALLTHLQLSRENDNRDLVIHNSYATTSATYIKLHATVEVDESTAKTGDVKLTVSGATSASPSEGIVARYGDFGVTVKDYSTTEIIAGKAAQDIGKLEIDEAVPGSLIAGRTITLTLPDNVKWSQFPTIDTDCSQDYGDISFSWVVVGSDAKMIKGTISGDTSGQTDPAKIVLKNMQVTPAVDFSGDLKVNVGGSQGVTGSVTLAKVKAPVTMTASAKPDVKIGLADQQVGDITITEQLAEAIKSTRTYSEFDSNGLAVSTTPSSSTNNGLLVLKAPAGVTFSGTPSISVESGDLVIDATGTKVDTTDAHEGLLIIKIKSSSTTPSTIKISNIKVTVDRTLPEGPLAIKISGTDTKPNTAIDETLDKDGQDTIFPGHKDAASVVVATCVTPAPDEQKPPGKVVFTINDTKFKVGDTEQTMDVAPYIKDGRTFIPVRYAAQACGVTAENILYSDGKVTLIKGDKVVQLTIGSNVMVINGVSVNMDVAPEIADPGRTMLPFRWVAQALGAKVNWDETAQTVTMEL